MAVEGLLLHRSRCSSSRSHCRLRDTSPSQDFRRLGRFRKIERWRPSRSSSSSCSCSRDRPRSKSAGSWPDLPLGCRRPSSRGKGGYLHKSNGRHSRTRSSSPAFARSRSRGQRPHRRSRSGSYSPSPHSFRSSRPRSRSRCRSPIFLKSSRDGDKDLDSYRSIRDGEFCGSHRHQDRRRRARSLYNSHRFCSRSRSYDWENQEKMQLQITPPLLQDCGLCSSVRPGSRLGVKRGLMLRHPRRGVRLDGKKDLSALLSDGIAREQKLQKIGNINADAVQWAQVHLQ